VLPASIMPGTFATVVASIAEMKWLAILPLVWGIASAGPLHAQKTMESIPDWQKAAGSAMAFEVASVREDKGPFKPPSFALSSDEWFRDPNGRFHADFALPTYIQFAYKIWLTEEEHRAVFAKLPEWVKTGRFDIEATAPLHATKDQYRLMMQTLLVERFGLKLHFEQRELPVLAMVLLKPGKPGPRLIPHERGQACGEIPKPETYPTECYSYAAKPNKDGMWLSGSRGTSMDLIGKFVGSMAGASGEIGRRVVDQTGLTGLWDFTIESAPPTQTPPQDGASAGPTMLEVVSDQLGIKLKAARAVVSVLVVEHLEWPGEN
jgi:uncharacterized protein (TIGR03435 family)